MYSLRPLFVLCLLITSGQSLQFGAAVSAVSPSHDLGFVVLLVSEDRKRLCPVSISKRDTDAVVSAEACTLLQLLQGIDTATALLPPDAIHKAFGKGEYDDISLAAICVDQCQHEISGEDDLQLTRRCDEVTAARRAPALVAAVKNLGIETSEAEAAHLLLNYSIQGELSRVAFAAVVRALRDETTPTQAFFQTSLLAHDGAQVEVRPFEAMALAIRHNLPLRIDSALFYHDLAFDSSQARTRFPLLTTITDLQIQALRLEAQSRELSNQAASIVANAFGPRLGNSRSSTSSNSDDES